MAELERSRAEVGKALDLKEGERNDLMRKIAPTRANSSSQQRRVAMSMRTGLRGLRREVERVVTRAFVGTDQFEGAVGVKEKDVIDLVALPPPSSPNSSEKPLNPPPPPKSLASSRTSTSGTAQKRPLTKKRRVE